MSDTFFIGDHKQMFPHLIERAIIESKDNPSKTGLADNVSIVNATDLSPIIEKAEVKVTVEYSQKEKMKLPQGAS